MLTEMAMRPYDNPRSKHRNRRNIPDSSMSFKQQIFLTFTVLLIITIFVLMISVFATKHVRTRRHYRRIRARHAIGNDVYVRRALEKRSTEEELHDEEYSNLVNMNFPDMGEEKVAAEESNIDSEQVECNLDLKRVTSSYVMLFTYIPSTISETDLKYAIKKVKMWAVLDPHIQTLIYIPANLNKTFASRILYEGCVHKFEVNVVDKLVMKSHATMRTLFESTYKHYHATWYGFAEYGTLFDSSLYNALRMLASCKNITRRGNIIMGQSHSMELRDWDSSITSRLDIDTVLEHISSFTVVDEEFLGNGVHYYFTLKHGFPWDKVPGLIPGSEQLDAFLMWFTMKNTSIAAVDATDAIFTLHQSDMSANETLPTTKAVRSYNEVAITKAKYPLYYKKGLGVIGCIEYVLSNGNSPYYLLTRRLRKYIRRIVKGKPVSLSYYCKIHDNVNVQLVETDGVIIKTPYDSGKK